MAEDEARLNHQYGSWVSEWKSLSRVWPFATPWTIYSSWNSLGQKTGVGCLSLLQGIFPTQGKNPGLPHRRQTLYQLSYKGSPRRLVWVVYAFSSGSCRPRNQTRVFCIAGGFFTNWAIREAQLYSALKSSRHFNIFFSKIVLGIFGPLHFHRNFSLSISTKIACWNFYSGCTKSVNQFG